MRHDTRQGLTRSELIECLSRIAVMRYVLTPKSLKTPKAGKTSVADAIEETFATIRHVASHEVLQNSQVFRRTCCYIEETDAALRAHEPALRMLFTKFSAGDGLGLFDGGE